MMVSTEGRYSGCECIAITTMTSNDMRGDDGRCGILVPGFDGTASPRSTTAGGGELRSRRRASLSASKNPRDRCIDPGTRSERTERTITFPTNDARPSPSFASTTTSR
jgi:hypothetical protein